MATSKRATSSRSAKHAVYVRRRLFVLFVLLLVVGLVVWGIWYATRPADAKEATPPPASESSTPTTTDAPTPTDTGDVIPPALQVTPKAESQVPPRCTADDVVVEAVTSFPDFGPGSNVSVGIRLKSQIGTPCSLNAGATTQRYTVKLGDDTWWQSTDCQTPGEDVIITLEPGQVIVTQPFLEWDRTRSNPDTCESPDRERAPAGGPYTLDVEIAGFVSSKSATFNIWDE